MKAESERGLGSTSEVLARCCGQGPPAAVTSEHYVLPGPLCPPRSEEPPSLLHPLPSLPRAAGGAIQSKAGVRRGLPAPHPTNLGFNVYFFIRMPAAAREPRGPQTGCGGWEGLVSCPCPPRRCSVACLCGGAPRPRPSVDPVRPKHIYFRSEQLIPPRESRISERRFENSDPSL